MQKNIIWSIFSASTNVLKSFSCNFVQSVYLWAPAEELRPRAAQASDVNEVILIILTQGGSALGRARCLPRCVSTWFIHLGRLRMSIVPGRSEETRSGQKKKKSHLVKSRPFFFHGLWFSLDVFLSGGCPWTAAPFVYYYCSLFFYLLFIRGEGGGGCWLRTHALFFCQHGLQSRSHKSAFAELPNRL